MTVSYTHLDVYKRQSLTKLMTALLLMENVSDLENTKMCIRDRLTDAMAVLARTGGMTGVDFTGTRYDMGNKLGVMEAQVCLLYTSRCV